MLVAPEKPEVTLHRRSEGWKPIAIIAPDAAVEFRSIKLTLLVAQIYARVF